MNKRELKGRVMNFYLIESEYYSYKEVFLSDTVENNVKICKECGGIDRSINSEKTMVFSKGKEADYYRDGLHNIISPKFQKILEDLNVSGYVLEDFYIEDKKDKFLETDLKYLNIHGRGGLMTDKYGEVIPNCATCHRVLPDDLSAQEGLGVDVRTWDGSDIFFFNNWPGNPIITESLKRELETYQLTNINFIKLRDFTAGY